MTTTLAIIGLFIVAWLASRLNDLQALRDDGASGDAPYDPRWLAHENSVGSAINDGE